MQSLLEADRIIGHYSNRIIYPQDCAPTCRCGEYPRYKFGGELLCEGCIGNYAEETYASEGDYCQFCGDDIDDECINILGDLYHVSCFERHFSID